MRRSRQDTEPAAATRVALGISTHLGWACVATVVATADFLRVIRTDRIETGKPGDAEALEPYHRAAGYEGAHRAAAPADPAALINRGLNRQRRHTLLQLRSLQTTLARSGHSPVVAALLVGRGRLAPSLDRVLASHAQIHIAEGLAVRESVATALAELRVTVVPIEHQTLLLRAAKTLGVDQRGIAARLRALKPEIEGAWRQEEKLAGLAARVAVELAPRDRHLST